jgi:threonine dehydrogenase-like Zn-dependent dehydrogenase
LLSQHAYAQHDVAATAALVRLPRELDSLPFPGEPLGCAMNVFERSGIESTHTVAIVGSGFLGVLLTQLAARASAGVFVTSRRDSSLEQARRSGASQAMALTDPAQVVEEGMRLTRGRGFDRVIEAAGEQLTLDVASALTAEHGRLVIAGYHQDGKREVNMQEWNWRGIDVVNAHERSLARQAHGIAGAVAAVLDGRMDPFPLFTHHVPLSSIGDAFELLQARPPGFTKALVLAA